MFGIDEKYKEESRKNIGRYKSKLNEFAEIDRKRKKLINANSDDKKIIEDLNQSIDLDFIKESELIEDEGESRDSRFLNFLRQDGTKIIMFLPMEAVDAYIGLKGKSLNEKRKEVCEKVELYAINPKLELQKKFKYTGHLFALRNLFYEARVAGRKERESDNIIIPNIENIIGKQKLRIRKKKKILKKKGKVLEKNKLKIRRELIKLKNASQSLKAKELRLKNEVKNKQTRKDKLKNESCLTNYLIMDTNSSLFEGRESYGAGVYRSPYARSFTFVEGAKWTPVSNSRVSESMEALLDWYNYDSKDLHPIVRAAILHTEFIRIHPFVDGNGRTARLLTNYELIKHGYPAVTIKNENKDNYLAAINKGIIEGDVTDLVEIIASAVSKSADEYLDVIKLAKAERKAKTRELD